jgi:hypothetical protein
MLLQLLDKVVDRLSLGYLEFTQQINKNQRKNPFGGPSEIFERKGTAIF